MATNVISIPSSTTLADARRIMDAHGFFRLPIIDRGKLVGIITKFALDRTGPSQLTTFNLHEISYLVNKITVKEVMRRDVVTVPPTMPVEEAAAIAQSKKVGALIAMEGERVVGIVTSSSFVRGILIPILGIGLPGSRITVRDCHDGPNIEKVISAINKMKVGITNLFITDFPETKKHDLIIHLDTPDNSQVIKEITKIGFKTEDRPR